MVSAAKYAQAEKSLRAVRPYGSAVTGKRFFFKLIIFSFLPWTIVFQGLNMSNWFVNREIFIFKNFGKFLKLVASSNPKLPHVHLKSGTYFSSKKFSSRTFKVHVSSIIFNKRLKWFSVSLLMKKQFWQVRLVSSSKPKYFSNISNWLISSNSYLRLSKIESKNSSASCWVFMLNFLGKTKFVIKLSGRVIGTFENKLKRV